MRLLDRLLQAWRARKAAPWVPSGARVLDVGCHQGEFLRRLGDRIGPSIGLDPLAHPETGLRYRLLAEPLGEPSPFAEESFDVVVLLATLEHIHDKEPLARECRRLLRPGGRVIVTVPAPLVDRIIALLCRLHLADGMSLEEHHGFDPSATPAVFARHGFDLEHRSRFQLGLNFLFVFRKPTDTPAARIDRVAAGAAV
jgi:SAM-dependent methyltransferase